MAGYTGLSGFLLLHDVFFKIMNSQLHNGSVVLCKRTRCVYHSTVFPRSTSSPLNFTLTTAPSERVVSLSPNPPGPAAFLISTVWLIFPSCYLSRAPQCPVPPVVLAKHDVNGNRTVPPFPEGLQMAMFGRTGHTEVVRVVWEPEKTSFSKLLKVFWESHNPTQGMRQGNDVGATYRSAIYTYTQEQLEQALASKDDYQKVLIEGGFGEITTEIAGSQEFYYAEDYHQQYLSKNPGGYCGLSGTGVSCPIGLKK
ncbi:mitochondrial peptide methionine sulfoxide reductase-like isoform X2 [Salvelinus fontinalis]|uniref:mitochondrial peptide methionine sulfoxide reductase-like isoform X2 n=1 Tax=Salvelinus fontinalis TaxID=8038 RepID=UPI002485605C|nr:mitochondrial peptide methionine sulfoxide reductase-like isoform X2 [Salvelinus fontinalis]